MATTVSKPSAFDRNIFGKDLRRLCLQCGDVEDLGRLYAEAVSAAL
jgi:hypothetical protein